MPREITSLDDLLYCIKERQPFARVINSEYYYFVDSLPKNEQTKWLKELDGGQGLEDREAIKKWSNFIGEKEFIAQMNNALQEWFNDTVSVADEEVYADIPLYGGAYVFNFFNNEPSLIEQLDIGLIKGFHLGNDSQHAMLGISIDKANEICIDNNLPIRFEKA